jgi:hypothetical protein
MAKVHGRDRLTFGWESLEVFLREANTRDLLESYWTELSPIKGLPLDVNWAQLLEWERRFVYRVWAARVGGTLAGFITFLVQPHVFHQHTLFAVDYGHYLATAFRDTDAMVGARMWRSAKMALKEAGVEIAFLHDNAKRPLSPFFLGIGARPFAAMWLWDLRDENHD